MKKTSNHLTEIPDSTEHVCSEKACVHCFENRGCIYNHYVFPFTDNNDENNSKLIQMPKQPVVRIA